MANAFKSECNVIINDNLHCATTYAYGCIVSAQCKFKKLGFNPINYFNSNKETIKGYFYENYSPGNSSRMYFSEYNAGRIDFFRNTIEKWYIEKKINGDEYKYLLACLVESVSFVANTAGVYGAYLKKWDDRALKDIKFLTVDDGINLNGKVSMYSDKIENIIEEIPCDVLYLDPPYTQNQYGTQYHLLETLILNDKPKNISKVTGSRSTREMRSDWSKKYKAHILLDKILAKTNAEHIFLSYNNDGDMSKEYIEAIMKRYDINTSHIVRLNEVELDGDKYEIRYKDECIHLPLKQFELLFELAKHPNQIFSREQLIEKIWGMDYDGFDRTVDVHIKRIRENIGHLPGFNVVTVRGLGYKVEVE